jgi:hypothetical protein
MLRDFQMVGSAGQWNYISGSASQSFFFNHSNHGFFFEESDLRVEEGRTE